MMTSFMRSYELGIIDFDLYVGFVIDIFSPFIIFHKKRMNFKFCLNKRNSGDKINLDSLPILNFIILIILYTFLPVNDFHNKTNPSTLSPLSIKHVKLIGDKKILRFYFYLPAVQSLQLFNLVSVFVLANGLELEWGLGEVLELYGAWPGYVGGVDISIFLCFVYLAILLGELEMDTGNILWVRFLHLQLDALETDVLYVGFHSYLAVPKSLIIITLLNLFTVFKT